MEKCKSKSPGLILYVVEVDNSPEQMAFFTANYTDTHPEC